MVCGMEGIPRVQIMHFLKAFIIMVPKMISKMVPKMIFTPNGTKYLQKMQIQLTTPRLAGGVVIELFALGGYLVSFLYLI